jgi:hypothetical protein
MIIKALSIKFELSQHMIIKALIIKFELSQHIIIKALSIKFNQVRPVGALLIRADGHRQTDMTKLVSAFRVYVNKPYKARKSLI